MAWRLKFSPKINVLAAMVMGVAFALPARAMLTAKPMDKPSVLNALKSLQESQQKKLKEIDSRIFKRLNSTRKLKLDGGLVDADNLPERLAQLQSERHEYYLRQDFINRLIFQVDQHWNGLDLRGFLQTKLLEMADTELKAPNGDSQFSSFMSYLSIAVRELAEPDENIVAFIQGYMDFSSVSHPKPPQKFLAARDYTNGVENQQAHGVPRDQVGVAAEKTMRAVAQLHTKLQSPQYQKSIRN